MSTIEFYRAPLNIRYPSAEKTKVLPSFPIPASVRYTTEFFRPDSEDKPDIGVTDVEFYREQQTIVFRHPESAPPSQKPDITKRGRVGMSHSTAPIPASIARGLPAGITMCGLIVVRDMKDRIFATPFTSLDKAAARFGPPELSTSLREAREQAYARDTCQAIGEAMTYEFFAAAFAYALPARTA